MEELVLLIAWHFGADKPFARINGPVALITVDSCWPLHNHLTYPASLEGEAQALPVERSSGGYHKIPIAYLRHWAPGKRNGNGPGILWRRKVGPLLR
jgi:hypothetical protein